MKRKFLDHQTTSFWSQSPRMCGNLWNCERNSTHICSSFTLNILIITGELLPCKLLKSLLYFVQCGGELSWHPATDEREVWAGSGEQCQVSCTWTMCTLETRQLEARVRVLFTALNCVSGESWIQNQLSVWTVVSVIVQRDLLHSYSFWFTFLRFLITANDNLPVHVNVLSTYKNKL